MANVADQTVNLTPTKGMDLRSLSKQVGSPFLQNVLSRNGDFQVRPGFGLVRAYDTTLNNGRTLQVSPALGTFALGAPVAVQTIRTSWGSDQIVTVHPVGGYNGNLRTTNAFSEESALGGPRGFVMSSVAVVVHDLESDQHFEFVLHQQDVLGEDLMRHFPHYATRFDVDYTRWLTTQRTPEWALIVPFEGAVIIAIDGCGLWCYRPVDTPVLPDRKGNSLNITTSSMYALGEVAALSPLNLTDGVLIAKEQTYLTSSEFGQPCAMGTYDNRMIYAIGNSLYFSDLYQPNAILAENIEVCPFPDPVTVVQNVRGTLFVCSAKQSWVYQPSGGTVTLQGGSWTMLSGAAGCVNNRAFALADHGLFFVEDSGVYSYAGGVVLQHISEPVDRLWTDSASLQMALTDYYTATGQTQLTDTQLPARVDVRAETPGARCHWNQERGMLFVTLNSVTLVYTVGFGWSVWYFASHAGNNEEVYGLATIDHPYFASAGQRLFMVGGIDSQVYVDSIISAFGAQSCYLLELGRGGAIDRSTAIDPAIRDAYTLVLTGYWTTGNALRVTINGVNYDTTMSAGNAAATDPLAAFAASVEAVVAANPEYFTDATLTGCTFLAQTAGTVAYTVSASVLSGTGTATVAHTRTGAAADNSEAQLEDQRTPIGGWVVFGNFPDTTTQPSVWLGQPVVVPAGYKTRTGATLAYESLWFPVSIGHWANGGGAAPTTFSLRFEFDNTVWTPILSGATAEFDFQLPTRRIGSIDGFAPGVPIANRQVQVYDVGTGLPDPAGGQVRINFDGTALVTWSSAPQLNMSPVGPDELVWIGFRNDLNQSCWQLPVTSTQVRVDGVASPFYAWQQGLYAAAYESLANKQQPLDWAVKTLEVQSRGEQIRVRGVYLTVQHLGAGNNEVTQFWQYGPLNTATSSDMRDYSGQAVDFFTTPPGNSEQNDIDPRKRLQTVTGTEPHLKTFNNIARWATTADPTKGNLLIDDAGVDTVATTDGTQGARASVMAHGTMNAPGDGVRLGTVEVVVRTVGGRRRWH